METPDRTINDRLGEMYPLFHWYSRRFVGLSGAEEDDLVQEAAIKVWKSMEAGYGLESNYKAVIENAMKDWVRTLSRQGYDEPDYLQPE